MAKITKLTAAQEARLVEFRDEYIRRGLSCEPADRTEAEAAIADAYRAGGLTPPATYIWLPSPMAGAIAAAMLANGKVQVWAQVGAQVWDQVWDQVGAQVWAQVGAQVWDQVRDQVGAQVWAQVGDQVGAQVRAQVGAQVWAQVGAQVRDQVGAQVWAQVGAQVGAQVWAQVGAQVWAQVWDQVWAQVGAQVRDQVGDQVWAQVGDQVRDQVGDQVGRACYGQHDAGWLSFYAYFAEAAGVADAARLAPLSRLSAAAGWWWPFERLCVVTDRPLALSRDAESRLHSESGLAIQYRDGWGVSAWHGTRIPDEWLTNKAALTPKIALTWRNAEQRRAACEILGWASILSALDAKTIDADADPEIGSLVEVSLPDLSRPSRFIRVRCGTGREFALGVPPEVSTALEGQAWIRGLSPVEFTKPEVRT